jgi:hypothetical protein
MSAPSIAQSYVDQFSDDVRFQYQQMGSRLKPTITNDPLAAENGYFEYIAPIEATERTGRAQEVVPALPEHERRKCGQKVYDASIYVDKFEQKIVKVALSQSYAKMIAAALGRKQDLRIVTQALGTNYGGRDGTTAKPFDTTNQRIAVNALDVGTGSASNLTTAKLRRALRILTGAEALTNDDSSMITVAYGAAQLQALLKICEDLKVDSLTTQSLASGKPSVIFMGMRFVRVADSILPKSGNNRSVIAYTPDALNFCDVSDISLEVNYIPTRKSWLVSGDFQGDSARMRENGVVEILCDETVA